MAAASSRCAVPASRTNDRVSPNVLPVSGVSGVGRSRVIAAVPFGRPDMARRQPNTRAVGFDHDGTRRNEPARVSAPAIRLCGAEEVTIRPRGRRGLRTPHELAVRPAYRTSDAVEVEQTHWVHLVAFHS